MILLDYKCKTASVNASATLETTLGYALETNVCAVTIVNQAAAAGAILFINVDGSAATASCFPIMQGQSHTVYGDGAILSKIYLYTGSATNVGFMQHVARN